MNHLVKHVLLEGPDKLTFLGTATAYLPTLGLPEDPKCEQTILLLSRHRHILIDLTLDQIIYPENLRNKGKYLLTVALPISPSSSPRATPFPRIGYPSTSTMSIGSSRMIMSPTSTSPLSPASRSLYCRAIAIIKLTPRICLLMYHPISVSIA
jgi:hypothetical protein